MRAALLGLRDGDRDKLTALTRASSVRAGLAQRARIVLLAADGVSNAEVARLVGVSLPTVSLWRQRYAVSGLGGLADQPRLGRPRRLDHRKIVAETLKPPKKLGVTHWSSRLLGDRLGIANSTVARAWRDYGVQPWRAETFTFSTDPELVAKVTDVVGLYLAPPESMYAYTALAGPVTEDGPRDAQGGKRGVRTELLRQRAASTTANVSVVASDLFGPGVRNAHAGDRMVPRVLASRSVRVLGSADEPHSFTYVRDYADAMIAAADLRPAPGTVLHAPTEPAVTQRQLVRAFANAAGATARVGTIPPWLVQAAGAAGVGMMRELAETLYQFEQPFVLDSTRSQAVLGQRPTSLMQAADKTVAWWRGQAAPGRGTGPAPASPVGTPTRLPAA